MVIIGNEFLPAGNAPLPSGWAAQDEGRALLRLAIRVASLERSVRFYAAHFNFVLQTPLDVPGQPEQRAFMLPADGASLASS